MAMPPRLPPRPQTNLTAASALSLSPPQNERADKAGKVSKQTLIEGLSSLDGWEKNETIKRTTQLVLEQIYSAVRSEENQKLIKKNKDLLIDDGLLGSGVLTSTKKTIYSDNPKSSLIEEVKDRRFQGFASPNVCKVCDHFCNASYDNVVTKPNISYFEPGSRNNKMSLAMLAKYARVLSSDAVFSVSKNPDLADLSQASTAKVKFTESLDARTRSEKQSHQVSIAPLLTTKSKHASDLFAVKTYLNDTKENGVEKKHQVLVFNTSIPYDAPLQEKIPTMLNLAKLMNDSADKEYKHNFTLACQQDEAVLVIALTMLFRKMQDYHRATGEEKIHILASTLMDALQKIGATQTTLNEVPTMVACLYYATKSFPEINNSEDGSAYHPSLIGNRETDDILMRLERDRAKELIDVEKSEVMSELSKKISAIESEINITCLEDLPKLSARVSLLIQNVEASIPISGRDMVDRRPVFSEIKNRIAFQTNERGHLIKGNLNSLGLAEISGPQQLEPLYKPVFAPFENRVKRTLSEILTETRAMSTSPPSSDSNFGLQKKKLENAIIELECAREYLYASKEAVEFFAPKKPSAVLNLTSVGWTDLRDPANSRESKELFAEINTRLKILNTQLEKKVQDDKKSANEIDEILSETNSLVSLGLHRPINQENLYGPLDSSLVQPRSATNQENVYEQLP